MTQVIVTSKDELQQMIDAAVKRAVMEAARPLLLTRAGVASTLQVSTRTVDRMVAAGDFPPPKNGRWPTSLVDRWVADRA